MTIACPDCGTLQHIPPLAPRSKAVCPVCRRDMEKTSGRSVTAALACTLAALALLIPANIFPLLYVDLMGIHRENVIMAGVAKIWDEQWVLLAGSTTVMVIVLPFLCFGLRSMALGAVRFGYRPPWLGRVFRWSMWLDPWSMVDVFLLASFVGYYRMINLSAANVSVSFGGGCFMTAGFLSMISGAALDVRTVWRAVGPEVEIDPGVATLSCTTCDLIQPLTQDGHPCPRCGARLHTRKPGAMVYTTALTVAAFALFFPANIYPMDVSTQFGTVENYTIFTGVHELFSQGLWPLGCIIFTTSIVIPFGKILLIAWCVLSVRRRSSRHLVAKTKIFRVIAELGRWSKTDPFTIVFFVPLVDFAPIASAQAGWGAATFMLMSIFTMTASYTFDPRLIWDAAQQAPAPSPQPQMPPAGAGASYAS